MSSKCLNPRSNVLAASTRKAAGAWGQGLGLAAAGSTHHRSAVQVGPPPHLPGLFQHQELPAPPWFSRPLPSLPPTALQVVPRLPGM